ncbi:hypothetical protein GN956_G15514 [Arapaima gigas]
MHKLLSSCTQEQFHRAHDRHVKDTEHRRRPQGLPHRCKGSVTTQTLLVKASDKFHNQKISSSHPSVHGQQHASCSSFEMQKHSEKISEEPAEIANSICGGDLFCACLTVLVLLQL